MQKKYKDEGFVAISVSLDDPNEEGAQATVLKFLKAKKAGFRNYILDEKPAFWEDKLKIDGPPCAFVYDRHGKVAKKFDGFFEYAKVEPLVGELLKKKE
jgi:hypothetical protein